MPKNDDTWSYFRYNFPKCVKLHDVFNLKCNMHLSILFGSRSVYKQTAANNHNSIACSQFVKHIQFIPWLSWVAFVIIAIIAGLILFISIFVDLYLSLIKPQTHASLKKRAFIEMKSCYPTEWTQSNI